jgi:tripeptide aminopeptidase
VLDHVENLRSLREIVLANTILCSEIPAPTGEEGKLVRFLCDRFTESDLLNISSDEAGNAVGLLPGSLGQAGKNILVAAHVDKIWQPGVDHTVTVGASTLTGPGVADNSLGVAAVASLPLILERLGLPLRHNLILLGASRSMGRGDLGGLRFFLDHARIPIATAVCIEGIQLGRLSYSSLGMNRAEITVTTSEKQDWHQGGRTTAISEINRIVQRMLAIPTPTEPKTSIILGSLNAGSAFNTPPTRAILRFEIRSEAPGMVRQLRSQIEDIVDEVNAERQINAELQILAHRRPGSIGFGHPLVKSTRAIMETLGLPPKIAPSTSELSVLLERHVPSLTLGVTTGWHKHEVNETIEIEPIFRGLAQIVGVLQSIDRELPDE